MSHANHNASPEWAPEPRSEDGRGDDARFGLEALMRQLADQAESSDQRESPLLRGVLASLVMIKDGARQEALAATQAQANTPGASMPRSESGADWDHHSAEALTRLYEISAGVPPRIVVGTAAPANIERPEPRGQDPSQGAGHDPSTNTLRPIGRPLARPRYETSLCALTTRLEELERRVDVAAGADPYSGDGEDGAHGPARTGGDKTCPPVSGADPSRLDGIENVLQHLVDRLSDERLAGMVAGGQEPPAPPPAAHLEPLPPPPEIAEFADRVEELSSLVDRVIDDQHRNSEAIMTMLATAQETMVRVLDRLDRSDAVRVAEKSGPEPTVPAGIPRAEEYATGAPCHVEGRSHDKSFRAFGPLLAARAGSGGLVLGLWNVFARQFRRVC